MLKNPLDLVPTQFFLTVNLFNASTFNSLIDIVLIALGVSPFRIDKGETFSKIALTLSAVELTPRHMEIDNLAKNR